MNHDYFTKGYNNYPRVLQVYPFHLQLVLQWLADFIALMFKRSLLKSKGYSRKKGLSLTSVW